MSRMTQFPFHALSIILVSMGTQVTIRTDGKRAIAVKSGTATGALTALTREAANLQQIRHPNVIEFIRFDVSDGLGEMWTVFAGDRTLASDPPKRLDDTYRVVASLAAAVADLHLMGVVHGRISPDHVIIGAEGRPILASFSSAGSIGEPRPDLVNRHPSQDVADLGALMQFLLAKADDKKLSRRANATRKRFERAALDAQDPDERRRPNANDLAAAVSLLSSEAAEEAIVRSESPSTDELDQTDPVPGQPNPTLAELAAARFGDVEPEPEPAPERDPKFARAAFVASVVVVGAAIVLAANSWLAPDTTDASAPVAATSTTTPSATTTVGAADDDAELAPRPTVEVDGVAYHIGDPGDVAATGDWDCDGEPTAALLRPSSGSVFVFEGWADADNDLVATALTTIDGATGLRAEPNDDGCDRLIVESPDGDIPFAVEPT